MAEAEKPKLLAVIPARGGSVRLPQKNILELAGKPILAYSIDAALNSGVFDQVMVSTDSEKIAQIAKEYGADVPFLRKAALADDHTPVSAVTADALVRLDPDGKRFDYVAQLMPNCPLRNAADVTHSFEHFQASGADAQMSVTPYGWLNPWWAMSLDKGGAINMVFDQEKVLVRSQDLDKLYCPTGAIWWAKCSVLRKEKTFHIQGRTGWPMPWYRAIDIDDENDLVLARLIMESGIEELK